MCCFSFCFSLWLAASLCLHNQYYYRLFDNIQRKRLIYSGFSGEPLFTQDRKYIYINTYITLLWQFVHLQRAGRQLNKKVLEILIQKFTISFVHVAIVSSNPKPDSNLVMSPGLYQQPGERKAINLILKQASQVRGITHFLMNLVSLH